MALPTALIGPSTGWNDVGRREVDSGLAGKPGLGGMVGAGKLLQKGKFLWGVPSCLGSEKMAQR